MYQGLYKLWIWLDSECLISLASRAALWCSNIAAIASFIDRTASVFYICKSCWCTHSFFFLLERYSMVLLQANLTRLNVQLVYFHLTYAHRAVLLSAYAQHRDIEFISNNIITLYLFEIFSLTIWNAHSMIVFNAAKCISFLIDKQNILWVSWGCSRIDAIAYTTQDLFFILIFRWNIYNEAFACRSQVKRSALTYIFLILLDTYSWVLL